jgi:hypothetical protein
MSCAMVGKKKKKLTVDALVEVDVIRYGVINNEVATLNNNNANTTDSQESIFEKKRKG